MSSGEKHAFEACKLVTSVDTCLYKVLVLGSGETYLSEALCMRHGHRAEEDRGLRRNSRWEERCELGRAGCFSPQWAVRLSLSLSYLTPMSVSGYPDGGICHLS